MINAFIRSDTFENKGYWLRKHVAWFSHRYNAHYGIAQLSPQSPRYQVARDSLAELQRASSLGPNPGAATQSQAQPKIIWMYWDAPLESAPEVVRLSVSSWQALNPDYEVRLLSDDNINTKTSAISRTLLCCRIISLPCKLVFCTFSMMQLVSFAVWCFGCYSSVYFLPSEV